MRFVLDATSALVLEFHRTFKCLTRSVPELPKLEKTSKPLIAGAWMVMRSLAADLNEMAADLRKSGDHGGAEAVVRLQLIQEELAELAQGLINGDEEECLDALGDLQYVLDGTWLALGMALIKEATVEEIHRSNMTKLVDGQPVVSASGRVTKPDTYDPPNLKPILEALKLSA